MCPLLPPAASAHAGVPEVAAESQDGLTTWDRFTCRADGGRWYFTDRHRLEQYLRDREGKELEVCVRIARKNRTLPQNSIIHALADQIADETGHSLLEIKRLATLEALGAEEGLIVFEWQGRTLTDVRGTSELSSSEASRVVDVLIRRCEELEIRPRNAEHVEVMP
jgi:hypothetical protein